MSSVVISGDTSGTVTLQAPAIAGSTTLTLPATSGTVVTTATTTGISGSAITTGTVGVSVGGTGANTLTANNVILGNGTSAVQFVAPGTNGNLLTSNGTTWTSAAAPAGGVTSLNGQTGAITDTGLGDIGSYLIGTSTSFANNTDYSGGQTFAGSSLVRSNADSGSSTVHTGLSGSSQAISGQYVNVVLTASQTSFSVSGTWRLMCRVQNGNISSNGRNALALFVRIS
jgi:hypothetical protein